MQDADKKSGFLSRWSRRKADARQAPAIAEPARPGTDAAGPPAVAPPAAPRPAAGPIDARPGEPPLTLEDAARLTRESDFTRFVAGGVEPDVKNAALKKLFSDPHFNLMDGLDVYIDDYSRPDPLPQVMLLKMAQAKFLGILTQETADQATGGPDPGFHGTIRPEPGSAGVDGPAAERTASDEDIDLQLQPYDAARRAGIEPGPGEDGGRGH